MAATVSHSVHFQIDHPDQVDAFLAAHPNVAAALADAREVLPHYFDDPVVALYVMDDPEDDGAPRMVAAVTAPSDRADARERIYRFRREWWRTQPVSLIPVLEFGID